ncbi:MAG: hypothetical protein OXI76_10200 [Gemmatimonadota bacterium]|nr:hypothetical protein [Gemmatimonadota bacterium]
MAGLGDVSTSFAEVVSEAGSFMLLTDGMVVEEAGEGSGFTFNLETFEGETIGFDLVSVSEYLDRVGRGELYFADVGREEADAAAVESAAPDWLSIYPGARHSASVVTEFDEFSFGIEVLLADASAAEILDWYKVSADDEDGWSLRASSSISLDAASADAPGPWQCHVGCGRPEDDGSCRRGRSPRQLLRDSLQRVTARGQRTDRRTPMDKTRAVLDSGPA